MTDLVPREGLAALERANPLTGELVDFNGPTDQLALALDAIKEQKSQLDSFASDLRKEVLQRMDHEATYTYRGGGLKLSGDGPRAPDYDGERLYSELRPLVARDVIGADAMRKAVETDVVYKPLKRGITALAKLPIPEVQAALKAAEVQNDKPRSVRVSRES